MKIPSSAGSLSSLVKAAIVTALLAAHPVFGEMALPAATAPEYARAELLAKGKILRVASGLDARQLLLAPIHPSTETFSRDIAAESPAIAVEALFLWHKPVTLAPGIEPLEIYNILRAAKSLEGIEYFSLTKGTRTILFLESYRVRSFEDRRAIPDERVALPQTVERFFVWQKDASFGGNLFSLELQNGPSYSLGRFYNETAIRFGPLAIFPIGCFSMRVVAISALDGIFFYVLCTSRTNVPGILKPRVEASFRNRSDALYEWFAREATRAWAAASKTR